MEVDEIEIQTQVSKFQRVPSNGSTTTTDNSTNPQRIASYRPNLELQQWPSSRIVRVSRASGGKDRHSKVLTSKGLRDRRVRLSVNTAIQFYDLQDRLGFDQPTKAVEWLLKAAASSIDELPSLDPPFLGEKKPETEQMKSPECSSTSSKGSGLSRWFRTPPRRLSTLLPPLPFPESTFCSSNSLLMSRIIRKMRSKGTRITEGGGITIATPERYPMAGLSELNEKIASRELCMSLTSITMPEGMGAPPLPSQSPWRLCDGATPHHGFYTIYLGAYDEEEFAARAYDLAAIKYWGTSTFTNFPMSEYEKELEIMQNTTKEEYLATLRRRSSGFSRDISKYRGVARHHHNGRWEASIGRVFGNKCLYLGTYS